MIRSYRALIVSAIIVLSGAPALAGSNYVVAGASPGGLWSHLGAGVERAVSAADPESTVTYQTSAGGFANVELITRGDVDLGIAHDAELKLAVQGKSPFAKPYPDLRAIAVLYDFALFHPLVTKAFAKKYGVRSLADIRDKKAPLRVVINRNGNIARDVAELLFAAHGITTQDIESWGGTVHTAGSRDAVKLVKGREADMITNTVFIGHSAIRELSASMPVRLLHLDDVAMQHVASNLGISIKAIPAGSYDWLDHDVKTLSLSAVLVADTKMESDTAYRLTGALIEHLDKLRSVHKSMGQVTLAMMASLETIPYHVGAAKAFREAGIEVPSQ